MDRRKFIKTSMCLGCGAAMLPASQSPLITELSSKFSKDKFIYRRKEDLPKKMCIEACSLCQLNCPACWMRTCEKYYKQQKSGEFFGWLKFEDFKNLVDDNPQIKSIELSHSGEIFLNPELDKIIEYAYKKNVDLTAIAGVNLNDLSEEMAEILVKYKFREIKVSIDGVTPETYEIYRVGGDYNRVVDNIKKINKYKKLYNSEFPKLIWQFIIFGHNEHEIELAKEKAKELRMDIVFKENLTPKYSPIKNLKRVNLLTGLNLNNEEKELEPTIRDYFYKSNDSWVFCKQLFEEPQISWDGTFLGCCINLKDGFGVNVFKEGLLKALNSRNIIYAKQMLSDHNIKPDKSVICSNCETYYMMRKYKKLLKYDEVKNG